MGSRILTSWRASREYARAFRLWRAGKPGEAARAFARVLELMPEHARAEAQRARALAEAGRFSEALKAARQAAELAPESHVPHLFRGQIHYDADAFEEARKAFLAAAERDPQNQLVQAYLGLTLLALGQVEEGAALLEKHLAYGYERLEGRLIALAEQYLWEHRAQARTLEQQLTVDEGGRDDRPAGFGLRVISALRTMVLWPLTRLRGPKALRLLHAEEAMSLHEFTRAAEAFAAAEAAGADPVAMAFARGQAYYEAAQPELAAEQLLRLPEEARREPEVAGLLGAALLESGRAEQARDYLTLAANRFRKEFAPAYYRGLADIATGRAKEATPWFVETADRLNPEIAKKRLEEMMRVRRGTNG